MNTAFFWLVTLPLAASPLVYLIGRVGANRDPDGRAPVAVPWLSFLVLLATWVPFGMAVREVGARGRSTFSIESIVMQMDGISLILAGTVLAVGTAVALHSACYMAGEVGEEKYYAMLLAMMGVMIGLGCAGDLFNLWVWFEAMAVSSYLLVAFYREQAGSLEAGMKYLVQSALGSVLVLLGIALVLAQTGTLTLDEIRAGAQTGSPALLAAGALFIIGFGVKIAMVPMHTWLPDAHSQAPAPVSGLMSGVLLSVAMYAILRVQAVGGAHIGVGLVHGLLIAFGLLSLAVAAFLTLTQRDYKRLLAYSSIEHMGIIALGVGSGTTLGLTAALLHMLGHGVVKAAMFVVAGRVLNVTGSSRIADVTGLLKRRPDLGWPFLVGSAALLGFPPFVTFFTEVAILVALTQAGLWWAAGGAALLLLVTFVGIARQVLGMTVGAPGAQDHAGDHSLVDDPPRWFRTAPVAIALASGAVVSFLALVFVPVLGAAAAALGVAR